ncbi:hypothetical protein BBJ28_00019434 [Nothophytophthora sp. Chile5]|nr:hypothetical protein BBJ28_00019434 [Nothophytophthora sp. Chile5]
MSSSNKIVFITGANRGIGLAFAEHYVKAGWDVIGTARNVDGADKLKALSPFKIVQMAVNDEGSIKQVVKELDGIPIDLLINNAGIGEMGSIETTTKESLMRMFEVNSVGPFLVTRALLDNLKLAAQANGTATVASVTTKLGSFEVNLDGAFGPAKKEYGDGHAVPHGGHYGYRSSKTALNMINSCLAMDLKQHNIIAIVLEPGFCNTDLTHGYGVIQPADSVAGTTKVIAGLTMDDTAKFFDWKGPEIPW